MAKATERLWSIDEAAEYLGVPKATLYTWASRGEGPRSYRVSRYRKYRQRDLDAYVDKRAASPREAA